MAAQAAVLLWIFHAMPPYPVRPSLPCSPMDYSSGTKIVVICVCVWCRVGVWRVVSVRRVLGPFAVSVSLRLVVVT